MRSIDMDVGVDVKVELDAIQHVDMLTQPTGSKVHSDVSPNFSPRSMAARVLVGIMPTSMPQPRGLQHGAWARRSSVPPTTFDDQVLAPPPLRKSRTAPYPQRSVAAAPRKPSQTPEPLSRGTMPLEATGSAIMQELLDYGGIAASTFDPNLRGKMLREKLIPADEIPRPRMPENDEQPGSPFLMTSRRCESPQEQPSTGLLDFPMSELVAECERFRERFIFESNTPMNAELSTQLAAQLMARSLPTNLVETGLVDRASAERAANELHRLRHRALVANAERARLELERAEIEAAELMQAELRELAEIESRTQTRLHAHPPADARGQAQAPAPAPAPSHAQARSLMQNAHGGPHESLMQNAHGGPHEAQSESRIGPEERSPRGSAPNLMREAISMQSDVIGRAPEERSPRGSAPSPLRSPSCSRPVDGESTPTSLMKEAISMQSHPEEGESTPTGSPMRPWSSPAWFASGMVGPVSGSGEMRAPSPGSQSLQQHGAVSPSTCNGLHACQSQVMTCHISSPISSLASTQALHAVPGTLVNGTLVQPNFVAQVMPSGAWPLGAKMGGPRRRMPMVQQSQIANIGESPLPSPSAVNPSTPWRGMGTASAHPMPTQPNFFPQPNFLLQPNFLPNPQPFHPLGPFGQSRQLLHAIAACQGSFGQSMQPTHASAAPATCAPMPSFLKAQPCMSSACTSATNTGPYHKQTPAPPPTILSACRTSCSPIGALTKPLHKEEVIASFLPTGM